MGRHDLSLPIFAMLVAIVVTAPAHAQRWGGGGTGAPSAAVPTHGWLAAPVVVAGPFIVIGAPPASPLHRVPRQSGGGSWDGTRPTHGGSPPVQPRHRGADLSGFFGYVPPRGATAQNAPVQSLHTSPRTVPREPQRTSPRTPPHKPPQVRHPRIDWPAPRP